MPVILFQIYNEMVRDLLNPSAGYLEMREDAKGGVQVANLSEVSTSSTEEVKKCGSWTRQLWLHSEILA